MKNTIVTNLSQAELELVNVKAHQLHDREEKRRRIRTFLRKLCFFF